MTEKCKDCPRRFNVLCDDGRCWYCFRDKWGIIPDKGCYAEGKKK